ncbi:hypothetical protein CRENBAI_007779 [Crenichthys baileyi]|uniref:Uncharacterized protein n=1 Tax=Crenichthys baileyi TaxID=28760 RepID=A0AAV9S5F2_9TELE
MIQEAVGASEEGQETKHKTRVQADNPEDVPRKHRVLEDDPHVVLRRHKDQEGITNGTGGQDASGDDERGLEAGDKKGLKVDCAGILEVHGSGDEGGRGFEVNRDAWRTQEKPCQKVVQETGSTLGEPCQKANWV